MKIFQGILIIAVILSGIVISINLNQKNCQALYDPMTGTTEQFSARLDCEAIVAGYTSISAIIIFIALLLLGVTFAMKKGFFERSNPNEPVQYAQAQNPQKQSSSATGNIETELQKAKEMLDKGLIDEAEYKTLKAKIIGGR